MNFRVLYNPEVYNDLAKAIEWYEDKQVGLGNKFLATAKKQMNSLQNSALHYSVRYDDIRCMPLKKFPYMVHFRVNIHEKTVKVEALFNTWLNPEKWTDRNKS